MRIRNVDDSAVAAALSCNTCTLKRASSCEGFAVANCQVFTFTVRPLSFGMRISAPVSVDTDHSCCIASSTRKTVDLQERRIEVADVDCVLLLITSRPFWSKELFILMCRTVCQIFFSIQVLQIGTQNQSWRAFLRCRPCS